MRERALARGARGMWRTCAEWHGRAAASTCGPSPSPRPVDRFATGRRASPVRNARTESVALAVAGVISGRTSASRRPYVPQSRRLIRSPGRSRAEGCGWDGRGVVSTASGAHGTAVGMELQLEGTASSSRCPRGARDVLESCWGRASSGPAAEDLSARPKYKGRLARALRRNVCFACAYPVPPCRPSAIGYSSVLGRKK